MKVVFLVLILFVGEVSFAIKCSPSLDLRPLWATRGDGFFPKDAKILLNKGNATFPIKISADSATRGYSVLRRLERGKSVLKYVQGTCEISVGDVTPETTEMTVSPYKLWSYISDSLIVKENMGTISFRHPEKNLRLTIMCTGPTALDSFSSLMSGFRNGDNDHRGVFCLLANEGFAPKREESKEHINEPESSVGKKEETNARAPAAHKK